MRELHGPLKYIAVVIGACVGLFHLYTSVSGVYPPFTQRGVHLLFLLPLTFLIFPATKKSPKDRITVLDGVLAFLAFFPSLYVVLQRKYLEGRLMGVTEVKDIEIVLGIILIILVIEAVRRCVAPVMAILVSLFLLYLPLGAYLPGVFYHKAFSLPKMIENIFLLSSDGVYGNLMGTSATQVILFILFGAFAIEMGAGEFYTEFARSIAGAARGGPAKIATLSSALFGTLSGSAVANVYATGTFSIPLMKRNGFSPSFAGAVEAAASTGGQIMPPIMGAAAFVLAENLGLPYIDVALCAILPAVLYYFSIWMMIDARCKRDDIKGEDKKDLPRLGKVLRDIYQFVPVIILFYLLCKGYSVLFSGFYSIVACVALSFCKKTSRLTPRRIINALSSGANSACMVAVALAGAGIIVVGLTVTGLALMIGSMIISLSQGYLILAMLLIAVVTIILGMGVPTTPAYVIAAAVGVSPLVKMGVMPIAAHLFVLYFAVISNITPPVAVAAYAGANIAKSDPMKTGVEAFILASAGYIVPFIFVFSPVLVMQGDVLSIILSTVTAFIGVYLLASGFQGYYFGKTPLWMRASLILAACVLIKPGIITDVIGIAIAAVVALVQRTLNKRIPARLP